MAGETVEVGIMFASKAFVQLLVNPIVGILTHRIGYSIPMFCGFIIMFISTISMYFLYNFNFDIISTICIQMCNKFSTVFIFSFSMKQFSHLAVHTGFYLWQERFKVSVQRVRPFLVWECWPIAILMTKCVFSLIFQHT